MTRAEVEALRDSMPARRTIPVALVWLLSFVGSWALVAAAYLLLPMVVAQGGLGLLAILGCGLLVAVTR